MSPYQHHFICTKSVEVASKQENVLNKSSFVVSWNKVTYCSLDSSFEGSMKDLRWMSNIGVLKDQEHVKFSDKQRLEETVARQEYFLHLVPVILPLLL